MTTGALDVHDGAGMHRFPPGRVVAVGRDMTADVHIADLRVSRRHMTIECRDGIGWTAMAVPGGSGLFESGEPVESVLIDRTVRLHLGDPLAGPVLTLRPASQDPLPGSGGTGAREVRIGRSLDNDTVLHDFLVSRHHAVLRRDGARWQVTDLNSRFGLHIDGQRATQAVVEPGDLVALGQTVLEVTEQGPLPRSDDAPTVECRNLTAQAGTARILDGISFSLRRGELAAVVGPTGSGKSTLLRTLSGAKTPATGSVLIHGHDVHHATSAVQPMMGFVPQDDILHPQLQLRPALLYGAELRFAPDVSAAEREARVDEVVRELGLTRVAKVPIHRLSGGQRKRTSVAMELLTAPSVLLLDEPTSGLDPGYEQSLMELLRELADSGRTVVVVTHSVQSLHLCDRILFLASGGRQAYLGPPNGALTHFQAANYAEAYQRLERGEVSLPPPGPPAPAYEHRPPASRPPAMPRDTWLGQLRTLTRRQVSVIAADRRMAIFLLAAPAVIGLLVNVLSSAGAWTAGAVEAQRGARTLVAALVVAATAIGVANTVREVVKERPIYRRELAGGMSPSAYLASKGLLFGAVSLVQVALLVTLGTARAGGPARGALTPWPHLELMIAVGVAALAASALGLLLSILVSSSEKAMALVPMVFVVQWLFSGVAIDLGDKPVVEKAAYVASANWGVAAVASTVQLYSLEARCGHEDTTEDSPNGPPDAAVSCDGRWQGGAWRWLLSVAMCGLIGAGLFALSVRLLHREDPGR